MPNVNIAFFHHTPFPAADVFNILHWREAIIDSLLCCNLCGFHIPRYVENFVSAARSLRDVKILEKKPVPEAFTPFGTALAEPDMTTKLEYQGRTVNVDAFPVGTNPGYIQEMMKKPEVVERSEQIRRDIGDNKLIVSAGRVDYVKGAKEMLLCYERLLERRPEMQGKVNLIMTAVKAASGMRVYKTAQSQIEQLVGKINGRYSKLNWTPILLFTEPVPFDDLMAFYKTADIAWIPPLRDGLNLVAKEYISAHGGEDGVLILSEFTGSAVELPDAVLTNPYADKRMDECIDMALDMSPEEQKQCMQKLYAAVQRYDVQQWANHMFREAKAISSEEDKKPALV